MTVLFQKRKNKKCADNTQLVRNRPLIVGIFPAVDTTEQQGCRFGEKCVFRHKEVHSQSDKKSKIEEFQTSKFCLSRQNSRNFRGRSKTHGPRGQRAVFKDALRHVKFLRKNQSVPRWYL